MSHSPVERRLACLRLAAEVYSPATLACAGIETANAAPTNRIVALAAEFDAFLVGPATADRLQDALYRIVAAGTRDLNEGIQGQVQRLTTKTLSPEAQIASEALAKLQHA